MKKNRLVTFLKGLGIELDTEIAKSIKKTGVFKIIFGILGFFILRYLVSKFGSENDLFKFYFIFFILILLGFVWLGSELKEVSKIRFLIDWGGQILMTLISLIIILTLLYVLVTYIIEAFMWGLKLFN